MQKSYPRPQLVRNNWVNLNGTWKFKFDSENMGVAECWYNADLEKAQDIQVPFTYETKLSGINEETFHPIVWYQKNIEHKKNGKRVILHFEGVDYDTKVWVNGKFVGTHKGAYARFSFDITEFLNEGENRLTVRVEDSNSCVQPRGKQRWKSENFGCWYVQTTGIWKMVWMEEVPENFIESIKITPDIDHAKVKFEIKLSKHTQDEIKLNCNICLNEKEITNCQIKTKAEYVEFEACVAHTEDPWQVVLWSPANPALYDVNLSLESDTQKDEVESYFGMRKISIEGDKVLLNNLPLYQRLILDQGYWEESGLTAPSEEALIKDVDLILAAGYNGLRKHEKVEDERFLYWCDKKGLLVWCEMPSQYTFNDDVIESYTNQWMEIVRQNYNHPCVITWTAFNESWGVERIFTNVQQQKFTEGIYHLTKAYDTMRPVIVNDGWEHTVSDILTLHDYEEVGEVFFDRYSDKQAVTENKIPFNRERYAFAKGYGYKGQPIILSEYGGIAFSTEEGWGYGRMVSNEEEFLTRFENIMKAIKDTKYIVGFCYTQITDVQQEINGLYTMHREAKVNIEEIKRINTL